MTETPRTDEQPGMAEATAAMRATREFMAGMAFGVPVGARDDFLSGLASAAYPIIAAAVLAEAEKRIGDLRVGTDHMVGRAWLAQARSVVAALRAEVETRG